jgi:hypothetical protein
LSGGQEEESFEEKSRTGAESGARVIRVVGRIPNKTLQSIV